MGTAMSEIGNYVTLIWEMITLPSADSSRKSARWRARVLKPGQTPGLCLREPTKYYSVEESTFFGGFQHEG